MKKEQKIEILNYISADELDLNKKCESKQKISKGAAADMSFKNQTVGGE